MNCWPGTGLVAALLLWLPAGSALAQGDADLEEVLGGFEDDDLEESGTASEAEVERFWDLSGSTSVGTSINYKSHRSVRKNTDFQGW